MLIDCIKDNAEELMGAALGEMEYIDKPLVYFSDTSSGFAMSVGTTSGGEGVWYDPIEAFRNCLSDEGWEDDEAHAGVQSLLKLARDFERLYLRYKSGDSPGLPLTVSDVNTRGMIERTKP